VNVAQFRPEKGWNGWFTRYSAPGAIPNGTRIMKVVYEENDMCKYGEMGIVLGSFDAPVPPVKIMYFVEWDKEPKKAVAILDYKITALNRG